MPPKTFRRIVLARPIDGAPDMAHFRLEEAPLPALAEGQFLIRTLLVSVDPGTRSRLSAGASYAAPLEVGQVIDGFAVGEVVESRHPKWAVGDRLACASGWADYLVTDGRGFFGKITDDRVPLSVWIGVLGVPGMTAYFGLKRVAHLQPGEQVLITSAAGPVGATAGQLAKAWGAGRVVGVAGEAAKGQWLKDNAGFDATIAYRGLTDWASALGQACPNGVDVLFDNVGNAMIDRVLPFMNKGGRIVISGQVGDYNTPHDQRVGVTKTAYFIANRLRMEGLVVFDDIRGFAAAQREMADMIVGGQLQRREIFYEGLDSAPRAFADLFSSPDFGRRIVKVAEPT
jgi:NADPH-dependent curcumin reductase CurA